MNQLTPELLNSQRAHEYAKLPRVRYLLALLGPDYRIGRRQDAYRRQMEALRETSPWEQRVTWE